MVDAKAEDDKEFDDFKKSLVVIVQPCRNGYEMIVTQRHLLKDELKHKKRVYLPPKLCTKLSKKGRCKEIGRKPNGDWDCKKCILDFYGVK